MWIRPFDMSCIMLSWFHPFTKMFCWLMGPSQVTTESTTVLLVIEHLRPTGMLIEQAKVFLFQLKRLYWETLRDSVLKAGDDGVNPTGGKAGPTEPPVSDSAQDKQTVLCQAVGSSARLSQWIRTGQFKAYPRPLGPQGWVNVKSDLWKWPVSFNSCMEEAIFRWKTKLLRNTRKLACH